MTAVYARQAQTFTVQGNLMTKLIAPSVGASEVMAWRAKMEPGAASPPHIHNHEEVVVILASSVKVLIGEEEHLLSAGDAFVVPPHTVHQVINAGQELWDSVIAMPVGTRFLRPDGQEQPTTPWTQ